MATQRTDGSWTETEPIPQALDTFNRLLGDGTARLFVVGTPAEIQAEKEKRSIEERLRALEGAQRPQSVEIHVPTAEELRRLLKPPETP